MSKRLLVVLACMVALLGIGCGDDDDGGQMRLDSSVEDSSTRDGGTDAGDDPDSSVADSGTDAGTDAGPPDPTVCMELHQRAEEPMHVMLPMHWSDSTQSLRWRGFYHTKPDRDVTIGEFGSFLAMVADGVERTEGARYYGWLDMLFDWQVERGWEADTYEDIAEAMYGLLRAHEVTGNAQYLVPLNALSTNLLGGRDLSEGGIWATPDHESKTTRVNATAALAAATIGARLGRADATLLAQGVYSFWWDNMVDPETFQVFGSMDAEGDITESSFTGDQGLMIGASLALYYATEDEDYLQNARDLASYLLSDLVTEGDVLTDGTEEECTGWCPMGKGIAFRWLLALWEEDPQASYLEVLTASVGSLYENGWVYRDSGGGDIWLFSGDWEGPVNTGDYTYLFEEDVPALTALNLASHLTPGCDYADEQADNIYEAEDARFYGLELFYSYEDGFAGSMGWNLLSGWDAGNEVTFTINIPEDGDYTLAFRYGAGGGDASRTLLIDDEAIDPDLTFTGTETWTSWSTIEYTATALDAGEHEITIRMTGSVKEDGIINLDNLTVEPAE